MRGIFWLIGIIVAISILGCIFLFAYNLSLFMLSVGVLTLIMAAGITAPLTRTTKTTNVWGQTNTSTKTIEFGTPIQVLVIALGLFIIKHNWKAVLG